MLAAYNIYVASKAKLPSYSGHGGVLPDGALRSRSRLPEIFWSLWLSAFYYNTFDQRICHVYWRDFIKGAVADCRPLLDYLQKLPSGNFSFEDLVRLDRRWRSKKRFWQCWRT